MYIQYIHTIHRLKKKSKESFRIFGYAYTVDFSPVFFLNYVNYTVSLKYNVVQCPQSKGKVRGCFVVPVK